MLPGLRRLCDEQGLLLIFEEVKSGIGGTDRMFASEHWSVAPDIVTPPLSVDRGQEDEAIEMLRTSLEEAMGTLQK